VANSLGPVWLP